MEREDLIAYAKNSLAIKPERDVLVYDCDLIIYLLENTEITNCGDKVFFGDVNCQDIHQYVAWRKSVEYVSEIARAGLKDGYDGKAYTGTQDFSHTCCEWDTVLKLGFIGLRDRVNLYKSRCTENSKEYRFYYNVGRVYDAVLIFLERMAKIAARENNERMANGLLKLTKSAPTNLFESLQTVIAYYVFQHIFDGTCLRSLGRLDNLLYEQYKKEKKESREKLLMQFFREIDKLNAPNNIPITLGGANLDGQDLINELSYDILQTYRKANTNNTKLHILVTKDIPQKIIEQAFESIREGNNSIVFINDAVAVKSLELLGESKEDAVRYNVVGCYECCGYGEIPCSCSGRVNIAKALEVALNGGYDAVSKKLIGLENDGKFETFDSLYNEFIRQLLYFCECSVKIVGIFERNYKYMHSGPIISATFTDSIKKGGDIYCDNSARYNNSSVNAIGMATAVDSLIAIKKTVYEDKTFTIKDFVKILNDNWLNYELLRLKIKNKYPKYGQGIKEIDLYAKDIVDKMAGVINGHKNCRGGIFRLGTFSIDWRWELGASTGASADGRKSGETLSQNTSATFGQDKFGATAHILSATTINALNTPNTSILDIDLHESATVGKNGIAALVNTLKTFTELGGFAIHYNVLNTDVLKKAYDKPEDYPNLQVRLCGWNVLFSSLSDKEKKEFIMRSIKG